MLKYREDLKPKARTLRANTTESENRLWARIRRKQLGEVQFYRQKPIGPYIVDFYAPKTKLVIEVDGSQHFEPKHIIQDKDRDEHLKSQGIRVLRFNNAQVSHELDSVLEEILEALG